MLNFVFWVPERFPAFSGTALIGRQGLHEAGNADGGVGVAAGEGAHQAGADSPAGIVVRLGQQQDELGRAAAGGGVPPPQALPADVLQVVHGPVQTAAGQGLVPGGGEKGDVARPAIRAVLWQMVRKASKPHSREPDRGDSSRVSSSVAGETALGS